MISSREKNIKGWRKTLTMKEVLTGDGSFTYFNETAQEHYHSLSGASEEARIKYVEPLHLEKKVSPVLFDICFGLGYNSAAALESMKEGTIFCFENDREILESLLTLNPPMEKFPVIKRFVKGVLNGESEFREGGIRMVMLFGDARENIKKPLEPADGVCFDPFSPRRAPDMWSLEFFKDIYSRMRPGASLTTYSCAGWIRRNMVAAGFLVSDGPVLGRKSPGTIATKQGQD